MALHRPRVEFSTLRRAGRRGFALTSRGRATVTTPARYPALARTRVRIEGNGRTAVRRIAADRAARLLVAPWPGRGRARPRA